MTDVNSDVVKAIIDGYADSETVASTQIQPHTFSTILKSIQQERQRVQAEVRSVSQSLAPDVDGWIQQAKKLQQDIERSKATAREIVQQAEEAAQARQQQEEIKQKSRLLQDEVAYTRRLEGALLNIKDAVDKLGDGQSAAVQGYPERALDQLEAADIVVAELRPIESTTVVELLTQRANKLKRTLAEAVEQQWDAAINIDPENIKVTFRRSASGTTTLPTLPLESLVEMSLRLNIFQENNSRSCRQMTSTILRPWLEVGLDGLFAKLSFGETDITVSGRRSCPSCSQLLDDTAALLMTLNKNLCARTSVSLSELVMPPVISHLIHYWLMPAIPTSLDKIDEFQTLLQRAEQLATEIDSVGWHGSAMIREWVEQGPKNWLAARREVSLNAVRNALSNRITSTQTVERTETRQVSHGDLTTEQQSSRNEWDTSGNHGENPVPPAKATKAPVEDDEFSAWDDPESLDISMTDHSENHALAPTGEEDDSTAWGWNEDDASNAPESPVRSRHKSTNGIGLNDTTVNNAQGQLTLKEVYVVTGVPDELRDIVVRVSQDAESLRSPQFEDSPIAPAAAALYTLPTLVLAGFRALAPTYYSPLIGGYMFLYNDSMRLAAELESFRSSMVSKEDDASLIQSARPSSRMRLEVDIAALEGYARRAYGKEMESQRVILRDMLDGAQGFTNCTEAPFAAECENAITSVVDRIRTVGEQWAPILSRSALLQSLGSLLSAVTSKMIVDIEDLSDIAEAESQHLRQFCNEISSLTDIFTQENPSVPGESKDMTAVYTSNWIKFQYLSEILESSLAHIKYFWHDTDLKLEFEAEELVDLVEALFSDTDHRRRAIADIRK